MSSPFQILDAKGRVVDGQRVPDLGDEKLVHLYESMRCIRLTDERMMNLQRTGRIGFYGTATGQEASTLGTVAALDKQDWVFPALREAGAAIYRGMPLDNFVAQLVGNAGDVTLGRQMPCHFSFREGGYVSMSSVIGTQIVHAAGVAIAAKIRGDDTVVMGYMGDGATSSNDFHSGLNFAAVKKAPVVFICQNNHWAISVPVAKQMASGGIAIKARGYGMPGVRVDGNDLLAVYQVSREAVTNAIDACAQQVRELDCESEQSISETAATESADKEPTQVIVRTSFGPSMGWVVDVIDNGPGVAEEDREKIFSLFESRKGMRGTGLGLPVSAKIMREHGGDLQVLDSEETSGTCFRLQFPADGTNLSEASHRDTAH